MHLGRAHRSGKECRLRKPELTSDCAGHEQNRHAILTACRVRYVAVAQNGCGSDDSLARCVSSEKAPAILARQSGRVFCGRQKFPTSEGPGMALRGI
jgi:hypothetical protein